MKPHEMVRRWQVRVLLLLLAAPCAALAETCTSDTGKPATYNFTLPARIEINPDQANGAILATIEGTLVLQAPTVVTCPSVPWQKPNIFDLHTQNYLGGELYESGIPGVGIRFRLNGGAFPIRNNWNFPQTHNTNYPGTIQLVKTGTISRGGTLSAMEASGVLPGHENFKWRSFVFSSMSVDPGRPTCKVTTPSISVSMAQAKLRMFTGVGVVSEARDFSIGVHCAEGHPGITTAVHGVLTDQTDPGNRSTTLSLSHDSTAVGVGVQILLNDEVLAYGADSTAADTENRWLVGSSGNGDFTIPLYARYVQTLPEVTAGSANARATFTLSYE